jgi:hypothetical protein
MMAMGTLVLVNVYETPSCPLLPLPQHMADAVLSTAQV